jgi:DNA-binding phage protein
MGMKSSRKRTAPLTFLPMLRLVLERAGGQAEVAEWAGVSTREIRRWLKGERKPAPGARSAIMTAYREMRRDRSLSLYRLKRSIEDPTLWSL